MHCITRSALIGLLAALVAVPAIAQSLTFSVDAVNGDLQAGAHLFGVLPDAELGLDAHDVPEPPPPPSDYLTLALRMPVASDPWPNRWHHEFRPVAVLDDDVELWELVLETDHPDEPVTVSVDLVTGDPSLAEVFLLTDAGRARMDFPTSLTLTPQAAETMLWIEVHALDPVGTQVRGFSEVKRLYR